MLKKKSKFKYLLANSYVIGALLILLLSGVYFAIGHYTDLTSPGVAGVKNDASSIVERSHKENPTNIVIDPNNIHYMDLEKNTQDKERSAQDEVHTIHKQNNTVFLLLLFYTVTLTLLIIYHMRQKRQKEILERKTEDAIRVLKIRQEAENLKKVSVSMWEDIEKYKNIFEPELNIKSLNQQLNSHPECCIADGIIVITRKVLEKILIPLHKDAFPHIKESTTLNDMIYHLNKKEVISKAMHNYARTIQSFGNMAAHSDMNTVNTYGLKEAESVINSLVLLLKELDAAKLLKV